MIISKLFVRYGEMVGSNMTVTKETFIKQCENKGIDPYDYGVENFILHSIIHGAPCISTWKEELKEYNNEYFKSGIFAYPFDMVSEDMIACKYHQRSSRLREKCSNMWKNGDDIKRVKRLVEKDFAGFPSRGKEIMERFFKERKELLKEYVEVRRKEVKRKKQDKHLFEFVGEVVVHKLQDFLENPEEDWCGWDIDHEPPTPNWGKSSLKEYFVMLDEALNRYCNHPDNAIHPADFEVFFPCPIGDGSFFKEVIKM